MANYGIGIGAFADGFVRGMSIGKQFREAKKEWDADKVREEAMDAARKERDAAIEAETARRMGIGPQGPATPDPNAPVVTPVDVTPPQKATPLPEGGAVPAPAPAPAQDGPQATSQGPKGMIAPGNIDLTKRPVVKNQDGSISTVRSMSVNIDGKEVLIPTVSNDGRIMSDQEAIDTYKRTGQHLGMFSTPDDATAYAQTLHNQQDAMYSKQPAQTEAAAASAPVPLAAAGLPQPPGPRTAMTREQARAEAEKSVPSELDFFQKKGVPRIAATYLAQGSPEKAEAWQKWAENAENQRNMKTWAKAYRATQMGDFEGAADHFFDLYKSYDDGVTPISKEIVKDKDGNLTGFNVKLKVDATGEERSAFIDRNQMLEMGLAALSPPQMFEAAYKRQLVQDKAKLDAAAKAGEIRMQTAKEIALENVRQGGRIKLEGVKHENDLERDVQKGKIDAANQRNKVQQELDAKVGALQKAGYSEEFINGALPEILGMSTYKKATSPEEAKRLAFGDRMKNDPSFARLPAEKQRALIEQDMALIYGGMKPTAAPSTPAAPGASSSTTTPKPAARGLPFLDPKTGKVVYK